MGEEEGDTYQSVHVGAYIFKNLDLHMGFQNTTLIKQLTCGGHWTHILFIYQGPVITNIIGLKFYRIYLEMFYFLLMTIYLVGS